MTTFKPRQHVTVTCTRCGKPIAGTPVADPGDRASRTYCTEGCLTSDAEGAYEQRYQPGVAT